MYLRECLLTWVRTLERVLEAEVHHFIVVFYKDLIILLNLLSELGVWIPHHPGGVGRFHDFWNLHENFFLGLSFRVSGRRLPLLVHICSKEGSLFRICLGCECQILVLTVHLHLAQVSIRRQDFTNTFPATWKPSARSPILLTLYHISLLV